LIGGFGAENTQQAAGDARHFPLTKFPSQPLVGR